MKQEILKLEGQWQTWDKWNTLGQVSPCTFEPGDGFAHLKAKGLWTEVRGGVFTPIPAACGRLCPRDGACPARLQPRRHRQDRSSEENSKMNNVCFYWSVVSLRHSLTIHTEVYWVLMMTETRFYMSSKKSVRPQIHFLKKTIKITYNRKKCYYWSVFDNRKEFTFSGSAPSLLIARSNSKA